MDSMYIDQKKEIEAGRKRKRCLIIGIAVVFAFFLLVLILGLTVFKAQHPITTVNPVNLRGFRAGIDPRRLAVDLNVTLDLSLSVMNPNKVSFEYQNSSSFLYYKRVLVGEADIPAGEILAGGTAGIQSTLTIMTDRLITNFRDLFRRDFRRIPGVDVHGDCRNGEDFVLRDSCRFVYELRCGDRCVQWRISEEVGV